jgi:hypothetical protein
VEYFGGNAGVLRRGRDSGLLDQFTDRVRANQHRKAGFICEFKKVVTEVTPDPEPSFLGKARRAPPDRFPGRAERGMPGCRHPGSWWNAR